MVVVVAAAVTDAATVGSGCGGALPPHKVQKNRSRCWMWRKKIDLTGLEFRCRYFFCATHRYADAHQCDCVHNKSTHEQLEKVNPVMEALKLEKILRARAHTPPLLPPVLARRCCTTPQCCFCCRI